VEDKANSAENEDWDQYETHPEDNPPARSHHHRLICLLPSSRQVQLTPSEPAPAVSNFSAPLNSFTGLPTMWAA